MSTLAPASKTHAAPSPLQPPPDHSAPSPIVSPQALEALLQSGPNLAREPKSPENATVSPSNVAAVEQELYELGNRVGKHTVEHILRNPDSKASTQLIGRMTTLLTSEKINTLLSTGNAPTSKKNLDQIRTHLSEEAINAVVKPLEAVQINAYRNYVEASLFDLKYRLMTAPQESRFNMIRSFANQKSETLTGIQDYLNEIGTKTAQLNDIATLVRKVNEPLQFSHPDEVGRRRDAPDSVQQPNVYRYLSINESTLESPSEIRGFTSGRDKLDVSGIGNQLNQKLQWVNQLSGASGEMQLRYSPNQDASVLIISGNKDEPAFVAKVFGKLKETDVVT